MNNAKREILFRTLIALSFAINEYARDRKERVKKKSSEYEKKHHFKQLCAQSRQKKKKIEEYE